MAEKKERVREKVRGEERGRESHAAARENMKNANTRNVKSLARARERKREIKRERKRTVDSPRRGSRAFFFIAFSIPIHYVLLHSKKDRRVSRPTVQLPTTFTALISPARSRLLEDFRPSDIPILSPNSFGSSGGSSARRKYERIWDSKREGTTKEITQLENPLRRN